MSEKKFQNLTARADQILAGEYVGAIDSLVYDPENSFAQAFLILVRLMEHPVRPFDEAKLRDRASDLEYLQSMEKVRAQWEELDPDWYHHNIGHFLGFLGEEETPVVLFYKKGSYQLMCPPEYRQQKLTPELAGKISENALFLIPSVDESVKQKGWQLLLRDVLHQKEDILPFFTALLVASVLTAVMPAVAGYITSVLIPQENVNNIIVISISLMLGLIAALCLHIFINRTKLRIETNSSNLFFTVLFGKIMDLAPEDESKYSGQLVSLTLPMLNAAGTMVSSLSSAVIFLIQCLIVLGGAGGAHESIRVIFYLLIFLELAAILILHFIVYHRTGKLLKLQDELVRLREEMINNISTIKSYGMEDHAYYRFAVAYDNHLRHRLGIRALRQWISIMGTMAGGIGILVLFVTVSGYEYGDIGQISAMITSYALASGYLMSFSYAAGDVANCIPYLRVADMILEAPSEDIGAGEAAPELEGGIEMKDVSFAYSQNADPVIRDVSVKIRPGEYIGIAGGSGSGKSTLIRLMLGFLRPRSGTISYDDREIGHYDIRQLRRQFGVVLQDSAVITGNIRMNIGMSEDADLEKVKAAAKKAAVYDDIEAMPMKYNTVLSSESELISGGQKQRIVLARALFNNPKILFLDEATSAMDNLTQQIVKENLDALGITRIMVAHRLSTLQDCDRILFMDKGRIVEEGSFEELMEQDGIFAKMARRNLL